ncbi:hypothetical protein [Mycolicibacterium sp. J2]|uniref:hypothetical protein n=1 Tax=Mycolicibacterium sp. J2 TaxID=2993511 RepID=UPI00224A9DBB|nr:hypothetical protein [Mycolicibacterium sp. J2]MCX2711181.1 hypothetical protein [Mycolicibacterium sp. J2]
MTDVSRGGAECGIRGSGDYATYMGREYFALRSTHRVWLFSNDDPPPTGFNTSAYDWVKSEKLVSITDIDELISVETTCMWRGHHFKVGIISNALADVFYLGKAFDEVSNLPGMERPDKYEVLGRVPVAELTDVTEEVAVVPLAHMSFEQPYRDEE